MNKPGFLLNDEQLNRLFPFFILIDKNMIVCAAGKSMQKFSPHCNNAPFEANFTLKRPYNTNIDFSLLKQLCNKLVVIDIHNTNNTFVRGQFEFIQDQDAVLFVGSPWFGSMDEVIENNFSLHDFAYHDPLIDLLHVLKSQEISNEELKALLNTVNKQKAELKKATNEIRDIALFPIQNPDPLIRIDFEGNVIMKNPAAELIKLLDYNGIVYDNDTGWKAIAANIDAKEASSVFKVVSENTFYEFDCRPFPEFGYINIYGRNVTEEKRKEEEIKLLSLAASANTNGVVFIDGNQKIRWVNESFEKITGFSAAEVIGNAAGNLFYDAEVHETITGKAAEAEINHKNLNIQIRHRRKDNSFFWANIDTVFIAAPNSDDTDKTWKLSIVEDITEKKKQQAEIERLSLVASSNDNGVLFTTPDGKISWANEGFLKLTGFGFEEIIGKTPIELCRGPLTDYDSLKKIVEAFFNGQPFNAEVLYYRKNGTTFWGRNTSQPIRNAKGVVTEFFGIVEDITEVKNTAEQIKILSQIAEDNINAVIIADKAGRIEWANKSFTEMTGFTLEEAKGKKPGQLLQGPETNPETIAYLAKQIKNGEPFNAEILNYSKKGESYWLRIQGQSIKNNKGEVTGFFALEENITKEKESEFRLRQVLEKLGDNVWEHDFRTGKTYFSKSNNSLLGTGLPGTVANKDIWWNSVLKEDLPKLVENNRKYENGEADSHSLEYRLRHSDGSIKWVLDRGVVIEKDKQNKILRITGTHTDITHIKEIEVELANRVKQFQSLSENVPGVLYEFEFGADGTERLAYISPASEKIFGIKPSEFIDYLKFIHPEDREKILEKNKHCRQTLEPFYDESRLVVPSRGIIWHAVHSSFSYITKEGAKIFTGFMLDITERKTTEARLEEQRKFYESILNNIPADIAVFNTSHEYLFVNPRGIKDDELRKWMIGKRDEDYCRYRNKTLEIAEQRRITFNKVVESKLPNEWEEKTTRSDGTIAYMLRRWFPVVQPDETVSLVIGYGIDITERKKFEEALKINEEKYRGIIANMNLGLLETDTAGKVTYANQSLLNMTGLSQDEILGFDALSIVAPESRDGIIKRNVIRQKGVSEAYEVIVTVKTGRKWWLVSSAPKFNDQKEFIGSVIICLDISGQKALQKDLIKAREHAEQLAKTKELFLANMSHEIRTPMNAIMGMSNQLSKTNLSGQQKFYLDTIHTAADNLLVIINDILDLSKIEAGKLSIEEIGFDIRNSVTKALQVFNHKAEEKGLILSNSFFDSNVSAIVKGDPYRLNQVLLNLLSNSVKFTEDGSVDLKVILDKNGTDTQIVRFEVTDTGIGMDQSFIEHLFDQFSQEYESITRKFGGTGLGMSISRDLVGLMGGKFFVESKKGVGSKISFTIQFKKGTLKDLPVKETTKITSDFLRNKKILIADDNDLNRLVALTILKNYAAEIVEASNGREAIEMMQNTKPDLILMDIQMPIMNGYEATKKIREINSTIPVIALTANAIKGENTKCIAAGMNDYISKPFKEEDFLKTIAKWLNTSLLVNNTVQEAKKAETSILTETLYDLSEVRAISRGNKAFLHRIVNLFCDQTPGLVTQMKTAAGNNDFDAVGSIAHKIKPSIDNLKINHAVEVIRSIEKNSKEKINLEQLPELIEILEQSITMAISKMKAEINN
jgi:PAS domain S-box-containing protein